MHIEDKQLKDFILDTGLVSGRDLAAAEEEADSKGVSIGDVLVTGGKLTESDLRRAQAHVLGVPFVDLRTHKMEFDVLHLIPEPVARTHNAIAFKKEGDSVFVAFLHMKDVLSFGQLKIKGLSGLKIVPRFTDQASIKHALLQYQRMLKAEFGDFVRRESDALKSFAGKVPAKGDIEGVRKIASDESTVRMFDSLMRHALSQGASDLHLEPFEKELVVRYRVGSSLRDAMILPKEAHTPLISRLKTLANLRLAETELPQEGRFKARDGNEGASFQILVTPTVHGEKAILRPILESASGMTIEALGLHGPALETVREAALAGAGLILVSGPARSGKTTALYALTDMANSPDRSVSTVEDPVERQLVRVSQTQVRVDIGLAFGPALRTVLRQDPDVIMVGDIRDTETALLVARAALAGKLVFAGIRANSSVGAVSKLMEMKADPAILAPALSVIISRRLVRRLSDDSRRRPLKKSELAALGKAVDLDRILARLKEEKIISERDGWGAVMFGFADSSDPASSYKGHVGVHEVMKVSPVIRELIARKALAGEIRAQAKKEGMMTLVEDAVITAAKGVTTIEEALRAVSE